MFMFGTWVVNLKYPEHRQHSMDLCQNNRIIICLGCCCIRRRLFHAIWKWFVVYWAQNHHICGPRHVDLHRYAIQSSVRCVTCTQGSLSNCAIWLQPNFAKCMCSQILQNGCVAAKICKMDSQSNLAKWIHSQILQNKCAFPTEHISTLYSTTLAGAWQQHGDANFAFTETNTSSATSTLLSVAAWQDIRYDGVS